MRFIAIIVVPSLIALAVVQIAGRHERAAAADRPSAVVIGWGGHVFTSRYAFDRWLRAHGSSYKKWARRYRISGSGIRAANARQRLLAQTAEKARRLHKHHAKKHKRHAANPQTAALAPPAPTNGTRRAVELLLAALAVSLGLLLRRRQRRSRSAAAAEFARAGLQPSPR